jgi:hypothetical protein
MTSFKTQVADAVDASVMAACATIGRGIDSVDCVIPEAQRAHVKHVAYAVQGLSPRDIDDYLTGERV